MARETTTEKGAAPPELAAAPRQRPTEPGSAGPVLRPSTSARTLSQRRRKLRWLCLGGAGLALVLLTILWPQQIEDKPIPPPPPLNPGILHEIGTLEALSETAVLTRFTGDIIWKIEEGTFVEAGEPVVRFETKAVEEDIEQREKDLVEKQENVRKAGAEIEYARQRYDVWVRQSEIELEKAEMERQRVYEYPTPETLLDATLSLKSAQLELAQFEVEMKGYDALAEQGYMSQAQRKKKQLEFATKRINHAKAKLIHDLIAQGSTSDSKRIADLGLNEARKRLQITRFNREAEIKVSEANLEIAQLDLSNFQRELGKKRLELQRATIGAPVRGRMAFTDVWKGPSKTNSPIQVGESRNAGADLGTICDTSKFRIRVWLNESDIARVRLQQRASVKLPAFPDKNFEAVVSELAVVATDKNNALSGLALRSAGEAFVNVVQAKLEFIDPPEAEKRQFRIGYTAHVYLHCEQAAARQKGDVP